MNLSSTIQELRKSIALEEKALNLRKEGLMLLEKAAGKLTGSSAVPSQSKKQVMRLPEPLPVSGEATGGPNRKPRPAWTPERRAKTLAALKKAKAAKKKAAK